MSHLDPSSLSKLQSRPQLIRNICILAHVDHGKTTLSDYLLSSNGVISRALAGKVRFLDSRADEQERQITMKSSSIALVFQDKRRAQEEERGKKDAATAARATAAAASPPAAPAPAPSPPPSSAPPAVPAAGSADPVYLINLIDSPGHVDFSSEVSTAVRSSDGALVLVDVVEGLCVQTSAVLRQAWREGVRPVLVLNKLDRLIVEVRMSAGEAYAHCVKLLETINAVASTFITSDAMTAVDASSASSEVDIDDDKQVVFSPEKGNVLFASAHDCWAFSLHDFARLYARLLGMKEAALQQCLWGEYYYLSKEKRVVRKPTAKQSKVMCVQLVFDVLWQVYAAVLAEDEGGEERVIAMMERLGVALTQRELLKEKERKRRLQAVMQKWLPISTCVLGCVVDQLPSPVHAQRERLERVWAGEGRRREGEEALREAMQQCDREHPDVMVYVSKMVDYGQVLERMRERTRRGQRSVDVRRAYVKGKTEVAESKESEEPTIDPVGHAPADEDERKDGGGVDEAVESKADSQRFLGFARVFAGTLTTTSRTQQLHVYLPRYHLSSPLHHLTIPASSLSLFLFMGVDLQPVASVPAGNVCGIGQLLDTGTRIASTILQRSLLLTAVLSALSCLRSRARRRHPQGGDSLLSASPAVPLPLSVLPVCAHHARGSRARERQRLPRVPRRAPAAAARGPQRRRH